MKRSKSLLLRAIALLLCFSLMPVITATASVIDTFPVIDPVGDKLIADEKTEFITAFAQDPATKLITATVQVKHGGDGPENLHISGIGVEISFNEKAAPYAYDPSKTTFEPSRLFPVSGSMGESAFDKYFTPLISKINDKGDDVKTFDQIGAQLIIREKDGGYLGTKLSCTNADDDLVIAPDQTIDIVEFYFMPVNGADTLDIDMFGYKLIFDTNTFNRVSTWIGYSNSFVQASQKYMTGKADYIVSPATFKMWIQRPVPAVSADNGGRTVKGYDTNTMEWSYDMDGPYTSGAPVVKDEAHTIYVRGKGDAGYSGDDEIYGAYKKYVTGGAAAVEFLEKAPSKPEWAVTDKNDAYGTKIPSNAQSYNAGSGVVFYWDQKQKDEGVLVIPQGYFDTYKILTIVVNSSNEYRKLTVTAPGSYDVTKWVDAKGKTHNINMVWIRFSG